jgi:hypothetical protein
MSIFGQNREKLKTKQQAGDGTYFRFVIVTDLELET